MPASSASTELKSPRDPNCLPQGFLHIPGDLVSVHGRDLNGLLRDVAHHAHRSSSVSDIIAIDDDGGGGLLVSTTTGHLAHTMGEAVFKAFGGVVHHGFGRGNKLALVWWRPGEAGRISIRTAAGLSGLLILCLVAGALAFAQPEDHGLDINGRTWLFGETLRTDGRFERELHIAVRHVQLAGEVREPLHVVADDLHVLAGAHMRPWQSSVVGLATAAPIPSKT